MGLDALVQIVTGGVRGLVDTGLAIARQQGLDEEKYLAAVWADLRAKAGFAKAAAGETDAEVDAARAAISDAGPKG